MGIPLYALTLAIVATLTAWLLCGCTAADNRPAPPLRPEGYPITTAPGAQPRVVYADEAAFFEGPTWNPADGSLLFTAWFKDKKQILRMDAAGEVAVWAEADSAANGTCLGLDGRLLTAEVRAHRVGSYAITPEGPADARVLAAGPDWNQPNDVWQSGRGDVYFTDPNYRQRELSSVYRLRTDGVVEKIITDMEIPNGIITSGDDAVLYVSDSYRKHWRSFDLDDRGAIVPGSGRVFFEPATENTADPDGMTMDETGNLYFTGRGGVWCVSPEGRQLGFIPLNEFCSNLIFGGPEGRTLYVTCKARLYALDMTVRGCRHAATPKP